MFCRLTFPLFLVFALVSCAYAEFVKGVVPSESGFDGAVTVVEETVKEGIAVVTVEIPYLDVHGKLKRGEGRLFISKKTVESKKRLPALVHAHYECNLDGVRGWCREGWLVATAHYKGKEGGRYDIDIAVGDGYNLCRALIQWVRRLPLVDRTRLHIDGGSQGGYMALAMSADMFPVTSTTADVPVVNWAYNINYLRVNQAAAEYPQTPMKDSPLPGLNGVAKLADMAMELFGADMTAETWYRLSPISYLDRIGNPVLMYCVTGDMLVPMEQMTRTHLRPYEPGKFPAGYQRDFDVLTPCVPARKTFEELVPPEKVHLEILPLPKDSFEITRAMLLNEENKPGKRPKRIERPWSKRHQWSICYLDEGPPIPHATHFGFEWATSPDSFISFYKRKDPDPDILTGPKLEHLMRRYTRTLNRAPTLADGTPANRLNFEGVEQRDVIQSLLDYISMGREHGDRLATLYPNCPLKPFGAKLDPKVLHTLLTAGGRTGRSGALRETFRAIVTTPAATAVLS